MYLADDIETSIRMYVPPYVINIDLSQRVCAVVCANRRHQTVFCLAISELHPKICMCVGMHVCTYVRMNVQASRLHCARDGRRGS